MKKISRQWILFVSSCLLFGGCASWREEVNFKVNAEREYLEPHEERRQQLYDLSQPR